MRIIIVGAGPAGAALALLLARNGGEVVLIERERDAGRVFRGEVLMPSGLDALYAMGLRDQVLALPSVLIEYWQIYLNRVPVTRINEPVEKLGDRALRAVSQPALLEMLVSEAEKHAGFRFLPGRTVRGLLRDATGRVCGVRCLGADNDGEPGAEPDAKSDAESEIEGDLVIGTDGRGSMVRKRADIALSLLPESYDILWLKAAVPKEMAGHTPIHIYAEGPRAVFSYVSWDGRWQLAWLLQKGEWREAKRRDWLAECAALMPEQTAAHLLAQRDTLTGPNLLDVIVGRCARWHKAGVLLLGDAAHPMSPIRAQGINMALRDAIVAANHLVPARLEKRDLDAACAALQREREREIIRVQKLQIREVRGQRWARERPWLMAPLLKLAPAIARLPFIEPLWLWQQKPLRFGVTDVRLEV